MKSPNQLALPLEQQEVPTSWRVTRQVPSKLKDIVHVSELRALRLNPNDDGLLDAIMELGARHRNTSRPFHGTINTPSDLFHIYRDQVEALDKVTYLLVIVGTKHHITHTFLYDEVPGIQSVLRRAVTRAAAAYFIVRNTDKPLSITIEEQNMIGDFVDKSDVIGIDFMDYVIIGSGAYMSAREEGCI
ncbi:MAG TPA: hypothetical protein DDZ66_13655 [Firmicutes bacterium]|nr:hypothetical protein [Bacillota bacterium]